MCFIGEFRVDRKGEGLLWLGVRCQKIDGGQSSVDTGGGGR